LQNLTGILLSWRIEMHVFVRALHGKEQPIGRVFISYARDDATHVQNTLIQAFDHANIPYFIDTQDIGITKMVSKVRDLIDDSACGVIVLSKNSSISPWVNYETGILEGMGKRILPFSLVSGSEKSDFIQSLPDYYSQYNVVDVVQDLVNAVRDETFIAGKLLNNTSLRSDIFSELKEVNIEFVFQSIPTSLWSSMKFGYLLVKFGNSVSLEQIADERMRSDGTLLNHPFYSFKREDDTAGSQVKIHFRVPVHKILGAQLKFFVDLDKEANAELIIEYLKKEGFLNIEKSVSAETQRLYFLIEHESLKQIDFDQEGITNNFIYPV